MQSHELFREVLEKRKPKDIAADLDLSTSMIHKWAEPSVAGIGNPLDRIEALLKSTGDHRLVQRICQRAAVWWDMSQRRKYAGWLVAAVACRPLPLPVQDIPAE
jgi:hypothetical protein